MSKFEDRLWRQLVREHGSDLAQMRRPGAKHPWRSRPRMLAGTTLGLAGIGTAAALLLGAASSSPAFAVTRNSDGTVSVSIDRLSGIAGANQKLASLGIRAKAVAVGAGCNSNWTVNKQVILAGSERRPAAPAQLHKLAAVRAAAAARIDPGKIPAGHTVVIAAWRAGQQVRVYASRAVAGPPPLCLAPAAAAARAAAAGKGIVTMCTLPAPPGGGNSGNTGNSGAARDTSNGGTTQIIKKPDFKLIAGLVAKARARANSGSSGSSGSSGTTGDSGNSGPGPVTVKAQRALACIPKLPPPGGSGNSGNSGSSSNSGNSGNSGSASSSAKAGSSAKH
jgi:hypothetical protein